MFGCVRSAAISNGQLDRFPWGTVLWGSEALPHFGETVQVPESLLIHGRNCRKVIARIVCDWGPGRISATMQQYIRTNQMDILETDRSEALEIAFLTHKVHRVADVWVQREISGCLRTSLSDTLPTSEADILDILAQLKKVQNDNRFACIPSTARQDIEALVLFLTALALHNVVGCPVRLQDRDANLYMMQCLDIVASWLQVDTTTPTKGKLLPHRTVLRGQEAAHHLFQSLSSKAAVDRPELELVKLRSYRWLVESSCERRGGEVVAGHGSTCEGGHRLQSLDVG